MLPCDYNSESSEDMEFFAKRKRRWFSSKSPKDSPSKEDSFKETSSSQCKKQRRSSREDFVESGGCDTSTASSKDKSNATDVVSMLSDSLVTSPTKKGLKNLCNSLSPDTTVPESILLENVTDDITNSNSSGNKCSTISNSNSSTCSDDPDGDIKPRISPTMAARKDKKDKSSNKQKLKSKVIEVTSLKASKKDLKKRRGHSKNDLSRSKRHKEKSCHRRFCKSKSKDRHHHLTDRKYQEYKKKLTKRQRHSDSSQSSSSLTSTTSSSPSPPPKTTWERRSQQKMLRVPKIYMKHSNRFTDSCSESYCSQSYCRSTSVSTRVKQLSKRHHRVLQLPSHMERRDYLTVPNDHKAHFPHMDSKYQHPEATDTPVCASCHHCSHMAMARLSHRMSRLQPTNSSYQQWNLECKVYIGGLDPHTTRQEIRQVFLKYGRLTNLWIAKNPPGFAFVEYERPQNAREAVRRCRGVRIGTNRIKVQMSNSLKNTFDFGNQFKDKNRFIGSRSKTARDRVRTK